MHIYSVTLNGFMDTTDTHFYLRRPQTDLTVHADQTDLMVQVRHMHAIVVHYSLLS